MVTCRTCCNSLSLTLSNSVVLNINWVLTMYTRALQVPISKRKGKQKVRPKTTVEAILSGRVLVCSSGVFHKSFMTSNSNGCRKWDSTHMYTHINEKIVWFFSFFTILLVLALCFLAKDGIYLAYSDFHPYLLGDSSCIKELNQWFSKQLDTVCRKLSLSRIFEAILFSILVLVETEVG